MEAHRQAQDEEEQQQRLDEQEQEIAVQEQYSLGGEVNQVASS